MGWLFTFGQRRAELIEDRSKTREWENKDGGHVKDVVLKHCYRGGIFAGNFYAVHERTTMKEGVQSAWERWIEVTMMRCQREGGLLSWGYKDMEEMEGPYGCSSCPLSYLEMVPEPVCGPDCPAEDHGHTWARRWREAVYAYHERQEERRIARRIQRGTVSA